MSFLKNLFGKKEAPIESYNDFWDWFQRNEKSFFKVLKNDGDIQKDFLDKLSPKLGELREGYFFLAGMLNDDTAELILTADGNVKNLVFVEELVEAAPNITGWKFKAHKPAIDIENVSIRMGGYKFESENLSFYPNEYSEYPDEIAITIVHDDYNEENKNTIINGSYIFLDNYLGELDTATVIDEITIMGKDSAEKELIPISKLKAYINWRQKEFIEKHEGVRQNTQDDEHSILEFKLKNGTVLLAVVNTDLMQWDKKASHPWMATIEMKFDDDFNGMPKDDTRVLLEQIEDEIVHELLDADGYLYIGRETGNNRREIYFACKDFRKPSKVLHDIVKQYSGKITISYNIYKDKYWQSFKRFAIE